MQCVGRASADVGRVRGRDHANSKRRNNSWCRENSFGKVLLALDFNPVFPKADLKIRTHISCRIFNVFQQNIVHLCAVGQWDIDHHRPQEVQSRLLKEVTCWLCCRAPPSNH